MEPSSPSPSATAAASATAPATSGAYRPVPIPVAPDAPAAEVLRTQRATYVACLLSSALRHDFVPPIEYYSFMHLDAPALNRQLERFMVWWDDRCRERAEAAPPTAAEQASSVVYAAPPTSRSAKRAPSAPRHGPKCATGNRTWCRSTPEYCGYVYGYKRHRCQSCSRTYYWDKAAEHSQNICGRCRGRQGIL